MTVCGRVAKGGCLVHIKWWIRLLPFFRSWKPFKWWHDIGSNESLWLSRSARSVVFLFRTGLIRDALNETVVSPFLLNFATHRLVFRAEYNFSYLYILAWLTEWVRVKRKICLAQIWILNVGKQHSPKLFWAVCSQNAPQN